MPPPPAAPVTILIPARLGSTRFPRKILASETGKPLIQHVVEAARASRAAKRVVVAAEDRAIVDAVHAFGGEAILTGPHPNGTSRLAEAARLLSLGTDSIVVNVQGDEPELDPALIDAAVAALRSGDWPMATVACPFAPDEDPRDPNLVKVVRREDGAALYFSRALIPFPRDSTAGDGVRPLKHVGLYAYRRPFLDTYAALPPTDLERTEQLEQLRVLAHGHQIAVAVGPSPVHPGIDTPEQYAAFVARTRAR